MRNVSSGEFIDNMLKQPNNLFVTGYDEHPAILGALFGWSVDEVTERTQPAFAQGITHRQIPLEDFEALPIASGIRAEAVARLMEKFGTVPDLTLTKLISAPREYSRVKTHGLVVPYTREAAGIMQLWKKVC